MSNPTGRDAIAAFAANGNPSAHVFLLNLFEFCDLLDDSEDESPQPGRAELLGHRVVDLCVNSFFRANADALCSQMRAMCISWAASNPFDDRTRQKYSGSPWQIVGYVAFLCGGPDRGREAVTRWINKFEES